MAKSGEGPSAIDFSGMRDEETGRIGRLLPLGDLPLPHAIELSGDHLRWTWGGERDRIRFGRPTHGLLDYFLDIQTPAEVLAFARRWGTLGICAHGLPATHSAAPAFVGDRDLFDCTPGWCLPDCRRDGWFREPVGVWLEFSRAARLLLELAGRLQSPDFTEGAYRDHSALWTDLYAFVLTMSFRVRGALAESLEDVLGRRGNDPAKLAIASMQVAGRYAEDRATVAGLAARQAAARGDAARQRRILCSLVNEVLLLCEARPLLAWTTDREPELSLTAGGSLARSAARGALAPLSGAALDFGHPLLGTLFWQVAAAVRRAPSSAFCSNPECGAPYPVRRRPGPNEMHFCPTCRKTVAAKLRKRRQRARAIGEAGGAAVTARRRGSR